MEMSKQYIVTSRTRKTDAIVAEDNEKRARLFESMTQDQVNEMVDKLGTGEQLYIPYKVWEEKLSNNEEVWSKSIMSFIKARNDPELAAFIDFPSKCIVVSRRSKE